MGIVKGLPNVIAGFNRSKAEVNSIVKQEVEIAGRATESEAKQNAPVDTGKHRQSIAYESANNGFTARISANEPYSAYLEFGTGTSVDIPAGFEDLAIKFKGKGKKQINLPARPHLIPAAIRQASKMKERLKRRLRTK